MNRNTDEHNDLFPDWDFSEPSWLQDEPISFTKENPPEPEPHPEPKPEPIAPTPSAQPNPVRKKPTAAPARSTPRTEPPASRPEAGSSWEQTRTSARKHRDPAPGSRRNRERTPRNPAVIVLIILLIGGMIFAGWQLGSILLGYQRDRSAYNDLAASALGALAEEDDRTTLLPNSGNNETPENTAVSEIPFTVDWDYLASVNPDIVGWLYCPDTIINYPVVQSEDHEYYLTHGFEGQSSSSGTLFADRDSVVGITQSHMIIYGHNMKDDSMFGILSEYADRSYFEEHPVFYYLTPNGSYRIDLICVTVVSSDLSNFPTYFSSTEDYQSYLNTITSDAYWVNSGAVTTDHQLMTFSTCTYGTQYDDARLLVHGMMVPIQ